MVARSGNGPVGNDREIVMSQTRVMQRPAAMPSGEGLVGLLSRAWQWIEHHRKARETFVVLSQMDDRELSDIGLNRGMLMNFDELRDRGRH